MEIGLYNRGLYMNIKNYLLLLIFCIIIVGCQVKENNGIVDVKIKDRYEFNNRIITRPLILEDNKKRTQRLAFVSYRKEGAKRIDELIVYDLDGKQYNSKKIEFADKEGLAIMATEAIDRNGDGVDEILVYDWYGRGWVFEQNGNKVKGYSAYDGLGNKGMFILESVEQFEVTINGEKVQKIVTVMGGSGGKYDEKYLLDVRTPGKDSLRGYPVIFGDDESISKPILAGENIYVRLFSGGEFLDGYTINGGKRLAGFPIKLPGMSHWIDMCIYKGEDIIFSDSKNFISRINLKNKKIDNVEIKGSKSIKNIKTGYADGEEYIYGFDDKDNVIYKINNKNKVADKLKINIEETFEFKYFNTFSINNANETYLFLIYVEKALMDIEKMFNKYGSAEEGKKIEEKVYRAYKNYYKTQELNVEQMKEAKEDIIGFKDAYLKRHLNEKYTSIRKLTPRTKVIIYKSVNDKIEQISSDEVSEYVLDMFFGDYPELRPSIYFNTKIDTLAFIVPLNKKAKNLIDEIEARNEKTIIKSYIFSDIK